MDDFIINTEQFRLTRMDFIIRLLVAVGTGFIIGLEREYASMKEQVKSFAGVRTFMFVVLLGFIAAMGYYLFAPLVFIMVLAAVIILTAVSYFITASRGDIGATTEFSLLISFLLGALTLAGLIEISLLMTVVAVVLLSAKFRLHSMIGQITAEELYDFIRFVVIALLIFPFLPNETYGPYNVINPREIGWVILLTSGLGFAGYVLMKFLGPRKGILFSGLVGGLISSTAVTWVFAKKSREQENISDDCAVAILAASCIMIVRVLVWTFIFNQTLFNRLLIPIAIVFSIALGTTLYFFYKKKNDHLSPTGIRQGKPLDLQGALVFGFIYTIILLVVSYANENLGESGLLLSSAVAGLSDIDAITITVARLTSVTIDLDSAAGAVLIATLSNTIVKMGIGFWAGSPALRKILWMAYGIIVLSLIVALLMVML